MVTFCEERTPQKKRGRKDKKKRAPPCKKGEKGATTTTKKIQPQKRKKEKKRLVAPQKKAATPRLDSVFKNSVTHSFFPREAYIKRFTLRTGLLDTTSKRVVVQ
jgi:hypothetical protein